MSDVRPSTRGSSRVLGAVLPGLPQLLHGRPGAGGLALAVWVVSVAVLATRLERVRAAAGGAFDERLSVLVLVLALASTWVWTWREAGRDPAEHRVGVSQWELAVRAFSKNRVAVAGLVVVVLLYLLALLTPLIAPHDPARQYDLVTMRLTGPSPTHPFGTDQVARDVLSRVLYGARISLSIGFLAVGISVTLGTLLGSVAGFAGGIVDGLIMRTVDIVMAFPRLVLLIAIAAIFEPSITMIVVVLGMTLWPATARIVRSEVLTLREREFIEAAEALGYGRGRIVLRHLVPNALGPVIVAATLGLGNTIVLEAGLSFLSLGVQPPTPSWGTMVADGRNQLLDAWWLSTMPGLAIVFTVLAFNVVGDGLRDALDPRMRS